jgi:transglutaminase-like putative cysteine protease
MKSNLSEYLQPTATIDCNHTAVEEFARKSAQGASKQKDQAIKLYYAVRDAIRYDPYSIELTVERLRASTTLESCRGWCVPKAILLAACCRALGIPARLGFADVRNHLSTARMRAHMKTDIFVWHGYTSIYIETNWVKATPAFNIELCEKFQLKPLDFDGSSDSIFHPFDQLGNKHMEYIRNRGEFPDVPIDKIIETFQQHYPEYLSLEGSDFDKDVDQELLAD